MRKIIRASEEAKTAKVQRDQLKDGQIPGWTSGIRQDVEMINIDGTPFSESAKETIYFPIWYSCNQS